MRNAIVANKNAAQLGALMLRLEEWAEGTNGLYRVQHGSKGWSAVLLVDDLIYTGTGSTLLTAMSRAFKRLKANDPYVSQRDREASRTDLWVE